MDPLDIHHVIRHPLSRIKTNNLQDKSGCSINGIRSFLFEEGIVQDLDDVEQLTNIYTSMQDYRGFHIKLSLSNFNNFPVSEEILKMKNVEFFSIESKPIHKLVSPEPHFVEEERNLLENHFSYLGENYDGDIEEWECFEMDCEGHLVSIIPDFDEVFHLSNESIEHLSNFPYLGNIDFRIENEITVEENVTNLSLLSNLRKLGISFQILEDQEFFKDLGLFTNLIFLYLGNEIQGSY